MSRHTIQIHVYVIIILKKTGKTGKFMIYILIKILNYVNKMCFIVCIT